MWLVSSPTKAGVSRNRPVSPTLGSSSALPGARDITVASRLPELWACAGRCWRLRRHHCPHGAWHSGGQGTPAPVVLRAWTTGPPLSRDLDPDPSACRVSACKMEPTQPSPGSEGTGRGKVPAPCACSLSGAQPAGEAAAKGSRGNWPLQVKARKGSCWKHVALRAGGAVPAALTPPSSRVPRACLPWTANPPSLGLFFVSFF